MAELDTSNHQLNNSITKQKFSFPKTERFRNDSKLLCDSFYEAPSTRTSRATSFGYGGKDIGLRIDKFIPPIGTYDLGTEFKNLQHKGFGFGSGRQQMELGGPLKDAKIQAYIPGPGKYANKSTLDHRGSSLGVKLADNSIKHLEKIPGPGAYNNQEIGSKMYYATSKFRNYTNTKISPGSRLAEIGRKSTLDVSPASYNTNVEELNGKGRYNLSIHENSKTRIFDKAPRNQLVLKHMLETPGPGQYSYFSSFG